MLDDHRIAGETEVRDDPGHPPVSGTIYLDVIVDESGRVSEVVPSPDYSRTGFGERQALMVKRAIAAARTWRFRPFVRDGKPIRVRAGVGLPALPAERLPKRHIPFPETRQDQVVISMARTGCYGSCPPYSVTIHGDGRVDLIADSYALVPGHHRYKIPPARVEALIRMFRAADFWSLDPVYEARITDNLTTSLTFKAGAASKTVSDYLGILVGMPASVTAIEEAIDNWSDSAAFLAGNRRTIAYLEAEGFDFRSAEASGMFLRSIRLAPEAVSLAMLDRGVRLDRPVRAWPEQDRYRSALSYALIEAVRFGRTSIFDRLDRPESFAGLNQAELDALLFHAARTRSPHLVERMLARGAGSRATDKEQGSALIQALADSYAEAPDADQEAVVRTLLRRGAPLEARDTIGWTALQHAYDKDPKFARMLIAAGANVNSAAADDRPILYLTEDEEIALIAIRAGADLSRRDMHGATLAQLARQRGWKRVEDLLARGAVRR